MCLIPELLNHNWLDAQELFINKFLKTLLCPSDVLGWKRSILETVI